MNELLANVGAMVASMVYSFAFVFFLVGIGIYAGAILLVLGIGCYECYERRDKILEKLNQRNIYLVKS